MCHLTRREERTVSSLTKRDHPNVRRYLYGEWRLEEYISVGRKRGWIVANGKNMDKKKAQTARNGLDKLSESTQNLLIDRRRGLSSSGTIIRNQRSEWEQWFAVEIGKYTWNRWHGSRVMFILMSKLRTYNKNKEVKFGTLCLYMIEEGIRSFWDKWSTENSH